ncbi:MAG: hypothetical protein ACI828_002926, partial [Flavobacteriales bacterium]
MQNTAVEQVKEVITDDIWGAIKAFLEWGPHLGSGKDKIHITMGAILVLIV